MSTILHPLPHVNLPCFYTTFVCVIFIYLAFRAIVIKHLEHTFIFNTNIYLCHFKIAWIRFMGQCNSTHSSSPTLYSSIMPSWWSWMQRLLSGCSFSSSSCRRPWVCFHFLKPPPCFNFWTLERWRLAKP